MKTAYMALVASLAATAATAAIPAGDLRIAWDNATIRDITEIPVVNKGYTETNIMYPRIKRLADGRLMMSFMNNTYGWEPYVAFSTDNGATWYGAMRLVEQVKGRSSAGDDELVIVNPDFIQLSDGTILLAYQRRWKKGYNDLKHTNENCYIEIMSSADGGATWTEPRRIYTGRCWEPAMLELPTGEIQMYITDSNEVKYKRSQPCTTVIRSFDGGRTWQGKEHCTYKDSEIISRTFDERGSYDGMATAVRLDDGSLIMPLEVWSGVYKMDQTPVLIKTDSATNWRSDQSIRAKGGPGFPAKKQINKDLQGYGPYICRLPSGHPVVLAGGARYKGQPGAWVLIGDRNGDNFGNATSPFQGYWGCIDYIGDDRVMLAVTQDYEDNGAKRSKTKTAIGRVNYAKKAGVPGKFVAPADFDRQKNNFWFLGKEQPSQIFVDFAHTPEAFVIDAYLFDDEIQAYTPENSDAVGVLIGRRNISGDYDCYKFTVNANGAYTLYRLEGMSWVLIDSGTAPVSTIGTVNKPGDTDLGFGVRFPIPWSLIGGAPAKGENVKAHIRHYYKTTTKEGPVAASIEEAEGENTDYPAEWLDVTII